MSSIASNPKQTGLTRALAARISALPAHELPSDVVEIARQALTDWFAVTLGGASEDAPRILGECLPERERTAGGVTVVGRTASLDPLNAALVNGTASHVLDYDDVNASFLGHASVAIGAAALALAEQRNASGQELLTAFVAGYETACRIAQAIGPQPYLNGFHYTGTVGTFGAAAACARLLELDEEQTAVALGLAATQAAGLKCSIGTMAKSLHAGKACQNGMLAASLAAGGFSGAVTAIESAQGFAELAGGNCDIEAALREPSAGWYLRDNLFKYHASCFFTHSEIEGVLSLRRDHNLDVETVQHVVLHVSELELGAAAIPSPSTGLEVKFSLAHLAAMALLGRSTSKIDDDAAHDQEAIRVRGRVKLVNDGVAGQPTRVELRLTDGRTVSAAVDVNAPERDLARQRERVGQKFLALARPVLGEAGAQTLRELLINLDERVAVRSLLAAAVPADGLSSGRIEGV